MMNPFDLLKSRLAIWQKQQRAEEVARGLAAFEAHYHASRRPSPDKVAAEQRRLMGEDPSLTPTDPLLLSGGRMVHLDRSHAARERIELIDCGKLESLPEGLRARSLILRNATALRRLPGGLDLLTLDVSGCTALAALPDDLRIHWGALRLARCPAIAALPAGLTGPIEGLDVSDCPLVCALPPGLVIRHWIDVAGSGLEPLLPGLADRLAGLEIRWRGVTLPTVAAFAPDSLDVAAVLQENNVEVRRVIIERIGLERLCDASGVEVLDQDRDAGGERRLLRLVLPEDEALVMVSVQCPSTSRRFVLRVPPTVTTCHEAVAWTAGFDDPSQYQPVAET